MDTKITAKEYKTGCIGCLLLLIIVILSVSIFVFFGKDDNDKTPEKNNKTEQKEIKQEKPEANTSSMVDHLIKQAKNNISNVDSNELNTALQYIVDNLDNMFKDNDTMEKIIYYGSLLEDYYAIDNNSFNGFNDLKGEIGMDAVQAVKYVYRNTETPQDQHVTENIKQIKENLTKIKQ